MTIEWQQMQPGLWLLVRSFDNRELWRRSTYESFGLGSDQWLYRHFNKASFAKGSDGDPERIVGRSFEKPGWGWHLSVRLGVGDSPFGGKYDEALTLATMQIHLLNTWNLQ